MNRKKFFALVGEILQEIYDSIRFEGKIHIGGGDGRGKAPIEISINKVPSSDTPNPSASDRVGEDDGFSSKKLLTLNPSGAGYPAGEQKK